VGTTLRLPCLLLVLTLLAASCSQGVEGDVSSPMPVPSQDAVHAEHSESGRMDDGSGDRAGAAANNTQPVELDSTDLAWIRAEAERLMRGVGGFCSEWVSPSAVQSATLYEAPDEFYLGWDVGTVQFECGELIIIVRRRSVPDGRRLTTVLPLAVGRSIIIDSRILDTHNGIPVHFSLGVYVQQ